MKILVQICLVIYSLDLIIFERKNICLENFVIWNIFFEVNFAFRFDKIWEKGGEVEEFGEKK